MLHTHPRWGALSHVSPSEFWLKTVPVILNSTDPSQNNGDSQPRLLTMRAARVCDEAEMHISERRIGGAGTSKAV